MEANKVTLSHKPPSDGGMVKEEFIRVGTTLYKIVEQPRLNGGYVKKRIAWNNETLRQDYGKDATQENIMALATQFETAPEAAAANQ